METMTTTSQEMLSYFKQLNDTERQSVLNFLKIFIANGQEHPLPQSLQDYNQELELADAEIEAGYYVSHEEIMNSSNNK
jgi:F0F1-type ATP synthase delta subunit